MNAQTPVRPENMFAATVVAAPSRSPWRQLRPVAMLAAAALGLGGAWWLQVGRFQATTDNAYLAGDIAPLGPRIEGDVAELLVADN